MRKFPDSLRLISRHRRLAEQRPGLGVATKPSASRFPKQGIPPGNQIERLTGGSHGQFKTRLQYHAIFVETAGFPQRPAMQLLTTISHKITTSYSYISAIAIDHGLFARYDSGRSSVPGAEEWDGDYLLAGF